MNKFGHGAVAVAVSSDCTQVILVGGSKQWGKQSTADTSVLSFRKCFFVLMECTIFEMGSETMLHLNTILIEKKAYLYRMNRPISRIKKTTQHFWLA